MGMQFEQVAGPLSFTEGPASDGDSGRLFRARTERTGHSFHPES